MNTRKKKLQEILKTTKLKRQSAALRLSLKITSIKISILCEA